MNNKITEQQILDQFYSYGSNNQLVGGEYERAIVHPNGRSVSYDEPFGIRWFLSQFANRYDWQPKLEQQNIIALKKNGASITLEPGGQFELSGAPHQDLQDLVEEFSTNRAQIKELAKIAGVSPITCGLTPITAIEDIGWMPKGRYKIMREYLPQKGELALYMMKGTTSVQANYDFKNEQDCAKKVQLCAMMAPLTTAIFANSPLYKNRPTSYMSYRGHIWTRTDPDRTGFPPGLRNDFTFEKWIQYLLDVPMMFIYRDEWIHAHGKSFREFINNGIEGHFPTNQDWELHMTSVFPEVRIKKTIEVRGADCVNHQLAVAFCALFSSLLYDEQSLDQALAILTEFSTHDDRQHRFDVACKFGLEGTIGDKTFTQWAEAIVDIAYGGLGRYQPQSQDLLKPLIDQIQKGCSPGRNLLAFWKQDSSPESVIRYLAY